jgi:4-oxalocrotonate tautomerase
MPILRIEMLEGRTQAQKQELAEVLSRETARITGCNLEAITIVFDDIKRDNWAVAGRLFSQPNAD